MAFNLRRLRTLDDGDFHIPEHHILLVINSWSHSHKIHKIGSFVCDVIIKYAYILPQILFGLARPISIDQRLTISNIDKYHIKYDTLKPLNRIHGFFGEKYLCHNKMKYNEGEECTLNYDNKLNNLYVAKMINHSAIFSSHIIKKKQRKTLRRMIVDDLDTVSIANHQNILSIKGLYRSPTNTIIVTDHLNGGSLFERIINDQHREWTEYDISIIIEQVLHGLHYMHTEMDIHHGHLRPSKILFEDNDSLDVKISSFGPGKMLSALCNTRHFDDTIYYKAPENVTNNKYSSASDMYAVGIITFQLLFGYHPFKPNDGYHHIGKYETKLVSDKIKKGFICKIRKINKHGIGAWFPCSKYFDTENGDIPPSIEAMDFIVQLLQYKPRKRYSAELALTHPFITNRDKLKANKISLSVRNSIKEFYHHSLYKRYITKLFENKCDIVDSQCIQKLKSALMEGSGEDHMIGYNRFIDVIHSNINDIKIDDKELDIMGINDRYKIPIDEFIGILNENIVLKEFEDLKSMLQSYDYYDNGYASIYQIKKILFKKYDESGQHQFVKQIIDRQQVDRAGMINYEEILTELHPLKRKMSSKSDKKRSNKNCTKCLKKVPRLIIIANETFAR